MTGPVLVEATRGGQVESRHRGAVCVADAGGRRVLALGDVDTPVFPRSAVKALQALPLIESGAADKFGLDQAEIALACASHSGKAAHVASAASMLAKAGRSVADLECGAHWPIAEAAQRQLAREGREPTALHNNCSGKHAGFVCLACAEGVDPAGYVEVDHPVQKQVRRVLEETTGARLDPAEAGVDGCSIPTWPIPLAALARAFARFGSGEGFSKTRAQAAERIRIACARHPHMVAGSGRFDTEVMCAFGARAFVKTGAEGVHCAAFPELGLGVAIKCQDGAGRAADVAMAAVIARFLPLDAGESAALAPRLSPKLVNWRGRQVGDLRATNELMARG
ncbi:MAG: asparaginase [Methylobacteriaceae bacterium]|nr:asparaginase [Methylobacteriaceae bacterium]